MRSVAHASFKRLQETLNGGAALPCVVLVGDPEARQRTRSALGGPAGLVAAEADGEPCVFGGSLPSGIALVEPPGLLGVVEATEFATYVKGLQHAHAVLLAIIADGASNGNAASDRAPRSESVPSETPYGLIRDFYSAAPDFRGFVAVALVGASPDDASAITQAARVACDTFAQPGAAGTSLPSVFCVEAPGEVDRLAAHFKRSSFAVPCEPLNAASPLLAQYRIMRQKFGQRRPSGEEDSSNLSVLSRSEPHSPQPQANCATPEQSIIHDDSSLGGSPGWDSCGGSAGSRAVPSKGNWTIMVFGKTGAGKSHLANLLLGHQAFASGDSLASVTNEHSVRRGISSDGALTVLDTIGFGDTKLPPETVISSLRDTALEAPAGIDCILFVLKKERVTPMEQEILAYVTQLLFGPECLPNVYIVITHAGRLAKDIPARGPWLKEQAAASTTFAAMIGLLGHEPEKRIAFVENPDICDADEEEREVAEKKRHRAFQDIMGLLQRHVAAPFRHGIMHKAGEFQNAHLQAMRKELRARVEEEVRRELDKDRGAFDQERQALRAEVEGQRSELKAKEEDLERRCEEEWTRMRGEFEQRARDMAREDLEPLAKEMVEQTEQKAKGRRCVVM